MAKKETQQAQVEEQAAPQQEQAPAPSLTLQDLLQVAQIIQTTSQRGAYRAEEMEPVGALYNKLIAFLQSTGAIGKPQEAPAEETKNA
jgi:hypothetical protein